MGMSSELYITRRRRTKLLTALVILCELQALILILTIPKIPWLCFVTSMIISLLVLLYVLELIRSANQSRRTRCFSTVE